MAETTVRRGDSHTGGQIPGLTLPGMTKFFTSVCLPPTAPRKVPQAIAATMAPYDANLTEEWNPVGHWGWWAIHSSTGNAYLVLPPHEGDRRLVRASTVPRRKAKLDVLGPLECYGGPRGLRSTSTVCGSGQRARMTPCSPLGPS